ncbi:transglutaminase-like enzyme, predicted cysteine protease [Cylindrospermum stagnale PCC 7417]|uniref:Transglutaminase-like enzyme, predicted cysteine protease n=1 Tax=Cylindrospermum stagnale PCC 7417 TaxID=56107 RepID=K9WRA2_9NOST|nr:transglutaminase-like domain-containing protein [Cylindrospermum stagnale]AFZ22920.1 transglutaminase-like enzyme, predicted cysteine protease [Cylindrospermum stagnale PCC 7417]
MKTPPFLLGAALIFWGLQTGLWIFALLMAVILEGSRFIHLRWDFSSDDFRRIANLCLMLLVSLLVYILITQGTLYFIYTLLELLPFAFFPLLAVQAYSVNETIDIRTLFLKNITTKEKSTRFTINLTYPYFALCIFSAGNANTQNISFYIGMFLLSSVAFWFLRSKRFSPILWLCLILLAGIIGFIGQIGVAQLQMKFEESVVAWLSNGVGQEIDAFKKQTSMGAIGTLKQSNDIVFRVSAETQQALPLLLREATYNKYKSSTWLALKPQFRTVKPQGNGKTWNLGDKPANSSTLTVSTTLNRGKGLLRLVDGTFQIDELQVSQMEKSKYGTVKVEGKVNDIVYQLNFNNTLSLDSAPTEDDLQIPPKERTAINQTISKLDIQTKSPQEILKRVDSFFQKNFRYSLKLTGKNHSSTLLSTFLLQNRSGHCEYFATATTLILRALGIPTRYAVGYSVHEFSNLEKQYIVRSRHAHAWTMVYLDNRWQAFDTTPADWTGIEDATASKWSFISDLWSFLGFRLSSWLGNVRGSSLFKYAWWLVLPFILIVMRRLVPQKGVRRVSTKQILLKPSNKFDPTRKNSEFYAIEKALNELGFIRNHSESLKHWIQRLKEELSSSQVDDLTSLIELHYRDRFDPAGIKETERAKFKSAVQSWLDKYSHPQ